VEGVLVVNSPNHLLFAFLFRLYAGWSLKRHMTLQILAEFVIELYYKII